MWQQISDTIWSIDYHASGIPTCRSLAIRLPDQSILLYSPPNIASKTNQPSPVIQEAQALGPIKHIVIPSNFHTLGMSAWHQACPEATLYTELSTAKRMQKFNLPFTDWRELTPHLPEGSAMEFAPLKFGELWIVLPETKRTLIVCEAFFNFKSEEITGFATVMAKLLDNGPGLKMSKIVKMMQLKPKQYGQWAKRFIQEQQPERLIPCHGHIVDDDDLPALLTKTIAQKLPG